MERDRRAWRRQAPRPPVSQRRRSGRVQRREAGGGGWTAASSSALFGLSQAANGGTAGTARWQKSLRLCACGPVPAGGGVHTQTATPVSRSANAAAAWISLPGPAQAGAASARAAAPDGAWSGMKTHRPVAVDSDRFKKRDRPIGPTVVIGQLSIDTCICSCFQIVFNPSIRLGLHYASRHRIDRPYLQIIGGSANSGNRNTLTRGNQEGTGWDWDIAHRQGTAT